MSESPSPPLVDDQKKRELDLRERELAARERELGAREAEIKRSPWLNPLVIALVGATLGLIGNAVIVVLNNRNSLVLERARMQSNLILEVSKSDQQNNCKNLIFFVEVGFLEDTGGRIRHTCFYEPQQAPTLGQPQQASVLLPGNPELSSLIPAIVQGGAPVGTKFQYATKRNGLDCVGEYVKLSPTEWKERPSSDSPPGCQADWVIFHFSERKSDEPDYFVLYDESRNLLARLRNTPTGQSSLTEWRLVTNPTWNVTYSVTRVN